MGFCPRRWWSSSRNRPTGVRTTVLLQVRTLSTGRYVPSSSDLSRNSMDPKACADGEAPVQLLLLRTEEPSGVGHRDDLWVIDVIRLSMAQDARPPVSEDVLRPISQFAIREGDQEAVVVFNRDDRRLIAPTGTASNVADDRGVGVFGSGRSHGERSCHLRESAQRSLDWCLHAFGHPTGRYRGRAEEPIRRCCRSWVARSPCPVSHVPG